MHLPGARRAYFQRMHDAPFRGRRVCELAGTGPRTADGGSERSSSCARTPWTIRTWCGTSPKRREPRAVVVSIDTRRTPDGYRVFTHNGTRETRHSPVRPRTGDAGGWRRRDPDQLHRPRRHAGRVRHRPDRDVVRAVDTPIIALGGAWTLQHMREAVEAGASAVTAGSMFVFFGRRRAVLVHFPDQRELREALAGDDRRAAPAGRP